MEEIKRPMVTLVIPEKEFIRISKQKANPEVRQRIMRRKEQFKKHIIVSPKCR